ncbi:extensin family protein [Modicisalibacter coralii]|uniref:extensin-like domain-containing protein n=1 Tax=Modicisalibacter coralii TaxID=2304602 RepID=UPI00193A86F7|nr:extensin family protein [Halomonas coralii]
MRLLPREVIAIVFIAAGVAVDKGLWQVPREWNPFAALRIEDPLTPVTRWKLGRLADDQDACRAVLARASASLDYTPLADYTPVAGCPLRNVVRLRRSSVTFNRSFVASCPLAVAWLMFERQRLQLAAQALFGEPVARVEHYGSFACRNIYHRKNARRSAHASANALDVAAFRLADGRRITLLDDWDGDAAAGEFLKRAHNGACDVFGTVLGPDYNAAHANHFHLAMRGFSVCR